LNKGKYVPDEKKDVAMSKENSQTWFNIALNQSELLLESENISVGVIRGHLVKFIIINQISSN